MTLPPPWKAWLYLDLEALKVALVGTDGQKYRVVMLPEIPEFASKMAIIFYPRGTDTGSSNEFVVTLDTPKMWGYKGAE